MYGVTTDSVTARTPQDDVTCYVTLSHKKVVDQSRENSVCFIYPNLSFKRNFCNGITVKKKERRIFGVEIFNLTKLD